MFSIARLSRLSSVRRLSTGSVEAWCSTERSIELRDTISPWRLVDLHVTLPTRDGSGSAPFCPPTTGESLLYGHHITFCHPKYPETLLNSVNGTEKDFEPPEPFARRMWVGGKWTWNNEHPLVVGNEVVMRSRVGRESVSLKGFEGENPMIFVNQRMEFTQPKSATPEAVSVVEERRHVYMLPSKPESEQRVAKPVKDIPTQVDFELRYTPSAITLFRFSALIFNAHYIHLDRSYAQHVAGYPDLLVHGPLSALMLLEAFTTLNPRVKLKTFEYRAHNPMIVDREVTIWGSNRLGEKKAKLWCTTEDGVVGMSAWVEYW